MRRPVRLLHTSDLHLHWQQAAPSLRSLRALRAAAEAARAEAVLMAGDIFDTAEQPSDFVREVAREVECFAAPVVMIPGNHDLRYSEAERDALAELAALVAPRHRLLADVRGEALRLLDGALHLWGRGMAEHTPRNDPLAGLLASDDPRTWSVVLAHGELMATEGGLRSSPIVLDRHAAPLSGVHYLALGHHDDAHVTRAGRTVVCYSGSASPVLGSTEYALVDLAEPAGASVQILRLDYDSAR